MLPRKRSAIYSYEWKWNPRCVANLHCECQELKPKVATNTSFLVLRPFAGVDTVKTVVSHIKHLDHNFITMLISANGQAAAICLSWNTWMGFAANLPITGCFFWVTLSPICSFKITIFGIIRVSLDVATLKLEVLQKRSSNCTCAYNPIRGNKRSSISENCCCLI